MTKGLVQIQLHFHLYDQHVQLLGVIIKIIIPISSYPTRCKEFQKKNTKKFKKLKNTIVDSFQGKTCWESPKKSKN